MIRKLNVEQVQELVQKPESGMGYQLIEAERNYVRSKFLVLNSQLIIEDSAQINNEIRSIFRNGFRYTLFNSSEIELKNIRLVSSLDYYQIRLAAATGHTGAIYQSKHYADGEEIFTRLSAYEDDFRIDTINKKLKPGSFTTTLKDYHFCKTNNLDPVDRYALPNDSSINWAFYIRPLKVDMLQRGIVEPANNHNGGGVEAYFESGTSDNTFFLKTLY